MNRLPIDLSPARWLWLPGERTLPNMQVVFRRELCIDGTVFRAAGWIFSDSRYLLKINGERIQWGPAPADPCWPEADPVDFTSFLNSGRNIITVDVPLMVEWADGDGKC